MFKTLSIKNYRGIKNLKLDNLNQINIFVGENGIGKTTLLDAIYIAINPNNALLSLNTNFFKGIDDPLNNTNFWKTFFYNFSEDNNIEIELKNNKKNRILKIEANFIDKNIILPKRSEDEFDNKFIQSFGNIQEKQILGLKINFLIDNKKYFSDIIQVSTREFRSQDDKEYKENLSGHYLNNYTYLKNPEIASNFSKVLEIKKKKEVIELLKNFKNSIIDLELNARQMIVVNDSEFERTVYANSYGDGFLKALHIICNILADDSNIILIDEIENGLHFKYQGSIFKSVLNLLQSTEKQLFATSHSYEFIKSFYQIAKQENKEKLISVFRLQKNRNDELEIINYFGDKLENTLEGEYEFR